MVKFIDNRLSAVNTEEIYLDGVEITATSDQINNVCANNIMPSLTVQGTIDAQDEINVQGATNVQPFIQLEYRSSESDLLPNTDDLQLGTIAINTSSGLGDGNDYNLARILFVSDGDMSSSNYKTKIKLNSTSAGTTQVNNMTLSSTQNALNLDTTIGSDTLDASAILTLNSTTKGLLPPRLTTTQQNAIGTPTAGLTLYNSTTNTLNYYNGSSYIETGGSSVSYISMQRTATKTSSNSIQDMFDTTSVSNIGSSGITHNTTTGTFTFTNAGIYHITLCASLAADSSTDYNMYIDKNSGTTAFSTGNLRVISTDDPIETTICTILTLAASDTLNFQYDSASGNAMAVQSGCTVTIHSL